MERFGRRRTFRDDRRGLDSFAAFGGAGALYPALKVEPQATVADFDARNPEGADDVIVPAMSRDDDPVVLKWLQEPAAKGATVIGVCSGAMSSAKPGCSMASRRRPTGTS